MSLTKKTYKMNLSFFHPKQETGGLLVVSNLAGTGESDRCKSRSTNGLGAQWRAQPWLPAVNPVSWCLGGLLLTGKSTNWESQRGFIRLCSGLIYLQVKIIADDHQESPSWASVPVSWCVTVRYSNCASQTQGNGLILTFGKDLYAIRAWLSTWLDCDVIRCYKKYN